MNSKCFARERVEELRSRKSLLESTLKSVKQNFWNIFKKIISSKKTPPYLYPTSTFVRLDQTINKLQLSRDPDFEQYTFILQLNDVDYNCNEILGETNKLQEALNQRICSLGMMKSLEYQPIFQSESTVLPKVYCAVDAVVFDLVKTILGKTWIEEQKFVPISLLDSQTGGYTVHSDSLLFTVPFHDSFRARFWPALAHEVAHILVDKKLETSNPFTNLVVECTYELRGILNTFDYSSLKMAHVQIHELASDIISSYVCPPSFLSAAINLAIPVDEPNSAPLYQQYPNYSHPPLDSRIAAMEYVLKKNRIPNVITQVGEFINGINEFLERKNMALPSQTSYELLVEYNDFARRFSRKLVSLFPSMSVKPFKASHWRKCRDYFFGKEKDLSPTEYLCVDWIKRLHQTKGDSNLSLQKYFEKRIGEPKIFEHMIYNLFKCYENMTEKIMEHGRFDVRIDVD